MQINLDCLKDVLLFCVDNIDYEEVGDNTWTTNPVSLETLYTALATKKYSRKDIMRSVLKLKESHYISVLKFYPENKPYLDSCSIDDVTMRGYQFAETRITPDESYVKLEGNYYDVRLNTPYVYLNVSNAKVKYFKGVENSLVSLSFE